MTNNLAEGIMNHFSENVYENAIKDLRHLLMQIGRCEFRKFGYAMQLRSYRASLNTFK